MNCMHASCTNSQDGTHDCLIMFNCQSLKLLEISNEASASYSMSPETHHKLGPRVETISLPSVQMCSLPTYFTIVLGDIHVFLQSVGATDTMADYTHGRARLD